MAVVLYKFDGIPMCHFPLDVVPDMVDILIFLINVIFGLLHRLFEFDDASFDLMILEPVLKKEPDDKSCFF